MKANDSLTESLVNGRFFFFKVQSNTEDQLNLPNSSSISYKKSVLWKIEIESITRLFKAL